MNTQKLEMVGSPFISQSDSPLFFVVLQGMQEGGFNNCGSVK